LYVEQKRPFRGLTIFYLDAMSGLSLDRISWALLGLKEADATFLDGPQTALSALTEWLESESALVRRTAAEGLGKLGPRAFGALVDALGDADAGVRLRAATALALLGSKEAVAPLNEALRGETNGDVRKAMEEATAALLCLREHGKPAFDVSRWISSLESGDANTVARAAFALADTHSLAAVEPLIRLVKHDDVHRSHIGALSLAHLNRSEATGPLVGLSKSGKWWHRYKAAWILARLRSKNEEVVNSLIGLLKDDTWKVRMYAAWALGRLEARQALPMLQNLARREKGNKDGTEAANAVEAVLKGRYSVVVQNQPVWLLVPDQDVPVQEIFGTRVTLERGGAYPEMFGYTISVDATTDLVITVWNGSLVYWAGKATIKDPWLETEIQVSGPDNKWLTK